MKLAIFDVDGTLVDSRYHIHHAMSAGFTAAGQQPLPQERVLKIVGLTLPLGVAQLVPDLDQATRDRIVEGYRAAYYTISRPAPAPLFPGIPTLLDRLSARGVLMAVATGKPRRGLDAFIAAHDLGGRFVSLQTADDHPSKPDPAMIVAALAEAGVTAGDAVMIGDTTFDMDMARAAGVTGLGVGWGYHAPDLLRASGAAVVARDVADLQQALDGGAA